MKSKSQKLKNTPKKAKIKSDHDALIAEYLRCHPLNRGVRK